MAERGGGRWAAWAAVHVALQSAFLLVLLALSPRFFWVDDMQVQYVPVLHWGGQHLEGARPPLMAPDLGAAGNLAADPQYGVLEPFHWLVMLLVGRTDNVNDAAAALGAAAVLVLGLGVLTLLLRYGCRGPLAVAVATGCASSGMSLWFGSSWWPMAWTTAWLCWLWYGFARPGRLGVLVVGLSAWLIAGGGYPYALPVAGMVVAAQVLERLLHGGRGALLARELLARLAAGAGGLLVAAPGLIAAAEMAPHTTRDVPDTLLGSTGSLVPNALDVLLGSTTAPVAVGGYGGSLLVEPVAALVLLAVPAAALVDWRSVLRRPGMPTALLLTGVVVAATQLPTSVGPFRYPFRFLSEVQIFLPVLVALGLTWGATVTRRRLGWAAGLLLVQLGLGLARGPVLAAWHVVAAVTAAAAVAALVALLRRPPVIAGRRGLPAAVAAVLLGTAVLGPVLAVLSRQALHDRLEEVAARGAERPGGPPAAELTRSHVDGPVRSLPTRPRWGTTTSEFRAHAAAVPEGASALTWAAHDTFDAGGWGSGVLNGNGNLLAGRQPGFGYYAAGHELWSFEGCLLLTGRYDDAPECVRKYLEPVPGDPGLAWLDVMTADDLLLGPGTPEAVTRHVAARRDRLPDVGEFARYLRRDGLPGRVTATTGRVALTQEPVRGHTAVDRYTVTTGAGAAQVVLRIPWWPGLRATADGGPVEVASLGQRLTVLRLPAGLQDADVRIDVVPAGERVLVPCLLLGAAVVAAATGLGDRSRRRPAPSGGPTSGGPGVAEGR